MIDNGCVPLRTVEELGTINSCWNYVGLIGGTVVNSVNYTEVKAYTEAAILSLISPLNERPNIPHRIM